MLTRSTHVCMGQQFCFSPQVKGMPAVGKASAHVTCSDGNRADNDAILQHHAKHQEDKVEQEHGETQCLIHLPLTGSNRDSDKEEHDEEQHDGTEEPVAADGDGSQTVHA